MHLTWISGATCLFRNCEVLHVLQLAALLWKALNNKDMFERAAAASAAHRLASKVTSRNSECSECSRSTTPLRSLSISAPPYISLPQSLLPVLTRLFNKTSRDFYIFQMGDIEKLYLAFSKHYLVVCYPVGWHANKSARLKLVCEEWGSSYF